MRRRSLLLLLTLSCCVLASDAPLRERPMPAAAPATAGGVQSASPSLTGAAAWAELDRRGWSASLQAAMQRARYAARPLEQPGVVDTPDTVETQTHAIDEPVAAIASETVVVDNPAHGLRGTVSRAHAVVSSRSGDVTLRATGIGHGDELAPLTEGEVTTEGARVTVARAAGPVRVDEWWVNRPSGLEHGFTVHAAPGTRGGGDEAGDSAWLRVAVDFEGPLAPRATEDGHALEFIDAAGAVALRYGGLHVFDATGRRLPARMHVLAKSTEAHDSTYTAYISADDRDAVYPVTIDPTFAQRAYLKAHNADAEDFFRAVAVSGDTVVVGAYQEDGSATDVNGANDNAVQNAGAAYVFVRDGAGQWSQQAYLKAHNSGSTDLFGYAVAVSGDTAVIGAYQEDGSANTINGASDDLAEDAGAAYVFVRDGAGQWSQQAYLKAHNMGSGDWFGLSVAVSGDTVAVGARNENGSATSVNGLDDNAAQDSGAAYVFVRDGAGQWSQQAYLKAHNTGVVDGFGVSLSVSADTVVVGAFGEDGSATTVNGADDNAAQNAGAAYVFVRDDAGQWSQQAYLKPQNTGSGDLFGFGVGVSGDTVVVGARLENGSAVTVNGTDDNAAPDAGAAYVFVRNGAGQWSQQAYLKPHNTGSNDLFGYAVALSGDVVVVGAYQEDGSATTVNGAVDDASQDAGAAYVFVRDVDGQWSQQDYLKAHNSGSGDWFGHSVAVSGGTVIAGAIGEDGSATTVNGTNDNSAGNAGAAYAFEVVLAPSSPTITGITSGNGELSVAFTAPVDDGGAPVTNYQYSTDDGATWVTPWASTDSPLVITGLTNGTAYTVRIRAVNVVGPGAASGGVTGTPLVMVPGAPQQAYLKAHNTGSGDEFGWAVAVSGDTVVVGAHHEDFGAGAAYVFVRDGAGQWSQQAYLKAEVGSSFGESVAVSGDTVVVGAAGAAYVFVRDSLGHWSQQALLQAHNQGSFDYFGYSVAVSADTVVIGALGEQGAATTVNGPDDNSLFAAGAAYVFVRDGTGHWSQQAYLKPHNTGAGDNFGWSVAVSGETVIVGAPQEDGSATGVNGLDDNADPGAGAGYVFVRDGTGQWSQQAYLKPHAANTETDLVERFGWSVAVSGATAVVGGDGAYVFVRDGAGQWIQQTYLDDGPGPVAVSGDTMVLATRVFVRDGAGQWSPAVNLLPHNWEEGDEFGSSVAVSGDTVVVGAHREPGAATSVNGASNNSAENAGAAYVFAIAPPVPAAPTITGITSGNTMLAVTFTAGSNGGAFLTNYEYSTDGLTWTVRSPASVASPLMITGLTNGTTYGVRIRAVNANGPGASSASSNGRPSTVPGAPTITGITPGDAMLSVAYTAGSTGGLVISRYEYSTNDGASWTTPASSSPLVITGLTNGTAYAVRIRAVNAQGPGAASNSLTGTPATVPGAPTGVSGVAGSGQVTVTFTAPASNGGSAITSYAVTASPGGATVTGAASPIVVRGLTNGTAYTFTVTATNAVGTGAPSAASASVTPTAQSVPVITTSPSHQTINAGESTTFTAVATGTPTPTYRWQVSTNGGASFTNLSDGAPYSGALTATLTITAAPATLHNHRYRVVATNTAGSTNSASATLTVRGAMTVAPTRLRFAAVKAAGAETLTSVTAPQALTVQFAGAGAVWTASTTAPWLQITSGAGSGGGQFSVAIVNPGNVIADQTSLTAEIIVAALTGPTSSVVVPITLDIKMTTAPPVGRVDSPAQNTVGAQGAIAMTGWAVDDVGIERVRLYRQCLPFDNPAACRTVVGASLVFLGDASVIPGARPDVEAAFPTLPAANAAGWGFLILSNVLPHIPNGTSTGGVGTFQLYAVALDKEGHEKLLGRTAGTSEPTTVTVANDTIAKPFGSIDTPGQGATVSGELNNFGWVLTPDTPAPSTLIPLDGSTITVFIDGVSMGTAQYNLCRGTVGNPVPAGVLCNDDVSTRFRGDGTRFRNLDPARGPIGLRTIDTRTLTNGLHSISWGVRDSSDRVEGIGSRFFRVLNSGAGDLGTPGRRDSGTSGLRDPGTPVLRDPGTPGDPGTPIWSRTGYDVQTAFTPLEPNAEGVPQVRIPEHGRVELQIPGVVSGSMIANGTERDLPVGVGIDRERGIVTWVAGPGYLGTYRLRFEVPGSRGPEVDITVASASTVADNVRMRLDRADVHGATFTLHGWALDPQAATGAGIGTVHVWGRRRSPEVPGPARRSLGAGGFRGAEVPGAALSEQSESNGPVFLGVAQLGVARPDVAAAHGAHMPNAGFVLHGVLPDAGEWEITAYVWVARTGRFEDARTMTVKR